MAVGAQETDHAYTLVVPAGALYFEGSDWTEAHRIYGIDLPTDAVWGNSFPFVKTATFEKKSEKDGMFEYEFRTSGRWFKQCT